MINSPKISFMTTLGVNVGDEFIREGICSFLDDIFDYWEPFYVNKHDILSLHQPIKGEVRLLKDKFLDADIIIQAGAPVYWKIGNSTSYNVEWAYELWEKRIFQLGPQKPIFNIAAGACQPYPDFAKTFISDPICVEFAKKAHSACRWTSVRDPLASQILYALGLDHEALPCTAFHASRRTKSLNENSKFLGINLMPFAGHYKLKENIDEKAWMVTIRTFLPEVRKRHPILFIAHDQIEKEFIQQFLDPGEVIFYSSRWYDYLQVYQQCKAVIANRVHGALCAAGFGKPAIIIGNDSRLLIGDYIDIPALYVNEINADRLVELVEKSIHFSEQEKDRLLTLREETAKRYCEAIQRGLENFTSKNNYSEKEKMFSLSSLSDILSTPFRNFMQTINCFARRWGFTEFAEYPEIWIYPWAWFYGLSKMDWKSTYVLSIDNELNPMPWFLASLGVTISLVGREQKWIKHWEKIRDITGLEVNWEVDSNGRFPFENGMFDVVISLKNNEHLRENLKGFNELIRVLRPGGKLIYSFYIYDPEKEMGSLKFKNIAYTKSQFEEIIWNHPALETNRIVPEWNVEESILSIKAQQKVSLPGPLVGCAILPKKK